MAQHILQNSKTKQYTLFQKDPKTGEQNIRPLPPKFSLHDKYASYRREVKREELKRKGLY